MDALKQFNEILEKPYVYLADLKKRGGKKMIGYFCSYTPEEIIYAAGAHPFRILGSQGNINLADAHLQAYSCSLVRGALEDALAGKLPFMDGTVFPHTCDSIQRLSDIWRLNVKGSFHRDIVMPVKLDTESAREYMNGVLNKFRRELGESLGLEISDRGLADAVRKYNLIRGHLKKIYDFRAERPGAVTGGEVYAIVKASMIMDRDDLLTALPAVLDAFAKRKEGAAGPAKKRIVLTGGLCNHPDIFRIVEEAGGVIVADDLCTGSRYFEGAVAEGDDLVAAIADRYMDRVVCPAKHSSLTQRGENVVMLAKDKKAAGVIFMLLKFCDPHAFDYPYMKEYLDKAGVPSMLFEVEEQLPSEGQLKTRFEAFLEMI